MQIRWARFVTYYSVGLTLIVLVAAVMRLLSFDFSLPYIDHPDEPSLYMEALAWRGLANSTPTLQAYPPAIIVFNLIQQYLFEPFGYTVTDAVYLNRLLSALSNIVALILIADTARRIAGHIAGLVAGAGWGLSPLVLEHGVLALADPHVYTLMALALWLAVVALQDRSRRHWCVWSFAVGLVAILFKYPALPVVIPGGLAVLYLLTRAEERRKAVRFVVIQAVLALALGVFLIFVYDVSRLDMPVTRRAEGSLLGNLLTPSRFFENLNTVISPLSVPVFAGYAVLGLVAYVYAARMRRPTLPLVPVVVSLVTFVLFVWQVSGFSTMSTSGRIRDIMPGTPVACVLLGAAVGQLIHALPPSRRQLRAVIVILPLLLLFVPQLEADWRVIQDRRIPDRRVDIRHWADINLEPGTIIVNQANHKTFNPFYGGIQGRNWYDWWVTEDITEYTVAEWIERGMSYAALDQGHYNALSLSDEGRRFLEQTLHLKNFFPPPDIKGPATVVFRLWRMQYPLDVRFGEAIHLTGYDISSQQVAPGDIVEIRFYWQASQPPAQDYSLFLHLTHPDSEAVLAQVDGAPARIERLTPTWTDPTETIIGAAFRLQIPGDMLPGEYVLRVGLYDYHSGERLPVITADDSALSSGALILTPLIIASASPR